MNARLKQSWKWAKDAINAAIGIVVMVGGVAVSLGLAVTMAKAYGYGRVAALIGYGLSIEHTVWLAGGIYLLSHTRR
jgi:hypothetical protein